MKASILVISRTPKLLTRFCDGLNQASSLPAMELEILCSWNGSTTDEALIQNNSRYDLHIAQRVPYHFAGNMNELAAKAAGDILILANDDLILDPGCLDAGMNLLESKPDIGLVGAVLRDQHGLITHCGLNFDSRYSAYHLLDQLIGTEQSECLTSRAVPAVTGALHWISKQDFQYKTFNINYKVCGEDIELCFDLQQHQKKEVWLCTEATAVHESESTRSLDPKQASNSEDQLRLRLRIKEFVAQANKKQLKTIISQQEFESRLLRHILRGNDQLSQLQHLYDQLKSYFKNDKENAHTPELLGSAIISLFVEQKTILLDLREERLKLKQNLEISRSRNS